MSREEDERAAALVELRRRLDDGLAHRRLTKTQLAARTGLGRTTLQAAFQPGGPVPSAATVAALAGKLGLPVEELLELRRAAAGEAGRVRAGQEAPGRPIGQWDPHDLEVHPAATVSATAGSGSRPQRALPGYVCRAHDQVLAAAVREASEGRSRMLVLVGSSSTGKTRACWEAVQPLAAEGWRLWHPHDPSRAAAALADLDRVAPRTVVWLNEAQHYLGSPRTGERIAAAVHTLLTHPDRRPVLVLGTLWPEYADSYTVLPRPGEPDPHSRVRELLAGHTVTVPDAFGQEALRAATALAQGGDRFITDALTRAHAHGRLTQELAGAPELLRRYEHGTPAARALLEVAMDARRLGVGLRLPQSFLIDAATDYFTDHDYDQLTEDWAEAAFAHLARPVHGTQAPLRRSTTRPARRPPGAPAGAATPVPVTGPGFRLADYLEQHGRGGRHRLCPPASFWHAAHAHLTHPDDLNNLATAANGRHRLQWAHHLRHKAADAGHPDVLFKLALMKEEAGDREGAETLYRRAADAGFPEGLAELAQSREVAGDLEGAETVAWQAAEAGYAKALTDLARLRHELGDREGGEILARQAAEAGHTKALTDLAHLRQLAGDPEGAESLYRQAAGTGDPGALADLAQFRRETGDLDGAENLYRQAADACGPGALADLARVRHGAGDWEGAYLLALQAVDDGCLDALDTLARIRETAGDQEGAEILAQEAAEVGYPSVLFDLARIREEAGDRESAEALFQQAADAGRLDALDTLARIRETAGDQEGAETLARRAAGAGRFGALFDLVRIREEAGDREGAERLARQAFEAGRSSALLNLARIRETAGDRESAETLYQQAADAGDPGALAGLARMREMTGDLAGAESLYRQAVGAGYLPALDILARIREAAGDPAGAEALNRQAADAGRPPHDIKKRWPYGLDPDGTPTPPWP
ncbi:tetratricopeptide repeat protein [Streptomyces sp. FXJ1.172]|uniref:tetratricopeptide repeat protein n=1 Tax=Streptomyces sp. FXJ1.172 TaxID=710705 RepID=UPI0007D02665|nr:tetratricopeptide repeat protein [Streptomyces sp. FXJ1.172]WEO93323.1 tetratricopeptide repeat protein [Streptomyces sp. FXJ1.172]